VLFGNGLSPVKKLLEGVQLCIHLSFSIFKLKLKLLKITQWSGFKCRKMSRETILSRVIWWFDLVGVSSIHVFFCVTKVKKRKAKTRNKTKLRLNNGHSHMTLQAAAPQ
jgi:hypothetical protein